MKAEVAAPVDESVHLRLAYEIIAEEGDLRRGVLLELVGRPRRYAELKPLLKGRPAHKPRRAPRRAPTPARPHLRTHAARNPDGARNGGDPARARGGRGVPQRAEIERGYVMDPRSARGRVHHTASRSASEGDVRPFGLEPISVHTPAVVRPVLRDHCDPIRLPRTHPNRQSDAPCTPADNGV